jgi:hypothetical protein
VVKQEAHRRYSTTTEGSNVKAMLKPSTHYSLKTTLLTLNVMVKQEAYRRCWMTIEGSSAKAVLKLSEIIHLTHYVHITGFLAPARVNILQGISKAVRLLPFKRAQTFKTRLVGPLTLFWVQISSKLWMRSIHCFGVLQYAEF